MKIAVVGLGIAGLSVCARLAKAGHDVAGFEQFAVMHARGSSHGDTRIIRLTPGEGEIYVGMAARAAVRWRDWEELAGAPLVQWAGGLMAGPPGSAFVQSCADLSKAHGHPFSLARGGAVEALTQGAVRLPEAWDVCRQEDCGVVFADAARVFLIKHAKDCGARLYADADITAPITAPTITIGNETQNFGAVVVAAGAWSARLLPEFAKFLTVKRRVTAWFKPRAPLQATPPVLCVDNDIGLFGMPTPDGLYKIGAHVVGDTVDPDSVREPDARDAALLSAQANAHLPLHDPAPVRMRSCLYTMTADENFLIAPSGGHPRVLLLSCCSGHGFKYAPVYGEIAEAWIDGRATPELDAFGVDKRATGATGLGASARE